MKKNAARPVLVLGAFATLAACYAGLAGAQDPEAEPNFGSVALSAGFTPDPFQKKVVAGGEVQSKHGNVRQWVSDAPDFKLTYKAGNLPLKIFARSKADTTLLVNLPDGTWAANDDSDGFNPALVFAKPQSGRYDIWVGTFKEKENPEATLFITELTGKKPVAGGPDPEAKPNFGSVELKAGFEPDPYTKEVVAGGQVESKHGKLTQWVSRSPDFKLVYTAGQFPLTIYATSDEDTTLLVNLPDGTWAADDDGGGGTNPQLRFARPQSGRYDIWVGTYRKGGSPRAKLHITEVK